MWRGFLKLLNYPISIAGAYWQLHGTDFYDKTWYHPQTRTECQDQFKFGSKQPDSEADMVIMRRGYQTNTEVKWRRGSGAWWQASELQGPVMFSVSVGLQMQMMCSEWNHGCLYELNLYVHLSTFLHEVKLKVVFEFLQPQKKNLIESLLWFVDVWDAKWTNGSSVSPSLCILVMKQTCI